MFPWLNSYFTYLFDIWLKLTFCDFGINYHRLRVLYMSVSEVSLISSSWPYQIEIKTPCRSVISLKTQAFSPDDWLPYTPFLAVGRHSPLLCWRFPMQNHDKGWPWFLATWFPYFKFISVFFLVNRSHFSLHMWFLWIINFIYVRLFEHYSPFELTQIIWLRILKYVFGQITQL